MNIFEPYKNEKDFLEHQPEPSQDNIAQIKIVATVIIVCLLVLAFILGNQQ